jgi:(1->4)-alpha-D-glucan 1-alpha-D-glucosylmutase
VWRLALRRWRQFNRRYRSEVHGSDAPSRNDEYLLYQTLLGAWPTGRVDQPALDAFRARIQAYMQKAVREAKVHTSWINADAEYEAALARFVDGLLGTLEPNPFLADFVPLASRVAAAGCVTSLAQAAIRLTAPGVPDTYQGTELFDFSLVDPDNRRPVDFAERAGRLGALENPDWDRLVEKWPSGHLKLAWTRHLLKLRTELAAVFADGDYDPLEVNGAHRDHFVAFARRRGRDAAITVVTRWFAPLTDGGRHWPRPESYDAALNLGGYAVEGFADADATQLRLSDLLTHLPVAVLKARFNGAMKQARKRSRA